MLQHQALWLGPWTAASCALPAIPEPPAWAIVDPVQQTFLGLARRRGQPLPLWFGGLRRPSVEVYETEDESLLFVLSRFWGLGGSWGVYDADGHRLGTLRGQQAKAPNGQLVAALEPASREAASRWISPEGQELGAIVRAGEGLLVNFQDCLDDQPFCKMVLLAMLLRGDT